MLNMSNNSCKFKDVRGQNGSEIRFEIWVSGARLLTSWRVELPPLQSPSFKGWLTNNPSKGGQLTSRAVYTASAITTSIINMTLEKSCRYFIDSAWQKSMHLEASVESTLSTTAVILVRFTSEETCFCFHVQYWALGTDHFLWGVFYETFKSRAHHQEIFTTGELQKTNS